MITLHGDTDIELLVNDNSYSYEAIMGEDTLTLYFSHPGYLEIPVGAWCEFYGKRYSLKKDSNFKKNGERIYEYTLVLETSKADMQLWKIRNIADNRIKFSNTAKPHEHLRLIVENLNRRSSDWIVGGYIESVEKTINYNHTTILDALDQLAETYETEWQITEEVVNGKLIKTISLRKVEYNKENPLALSYGKGHGFKVGVGRESGEIPPEIILVETTDRNIDYSKYSIKDIEPEYRSKELLMPNSQKIRYDGTHFENEDGFNASIARTYKTDECGTSVMRADKKLTTGKEDNLDCTEIYPSRVGMVSNVITADASKNFYDFIDKDIPDDLNFEDCLIEGEKMTVVFQSGMLSGKEFEVKYVHANRGFEVVPQEIDGITMPDGGAWMPKIGDKYAVFGIQLPEAYICDNATKTGASWDVFREAVKYLYKHEGKEFTFTGTLDGIWAKKRWLEVGGKIVLGGYVNFSDTQFHPDGSLIRMTGIKRYVNNPFSPDIELSNSPVGTSIASDLNKIETNEVTVDENHKKAQQFTKRYYRDAKETMEMLADSLLNFSGAINPITVATMQMLVGDESLQFRFVNSKTNPVVVNHEITYNSSTKKLHVPAGILQHMTLEIKEVSSDHKASDYKFWDMRDASLTPEKSDEKYYLYAKCSKDNQPNDFLLSPTAIALKQVNGYYHFLVGILNSENDGERSFATVYGFTEILPGRITTDKIVSSDGRTYFDLKDGEIGGRLKFLSSKGLADMGDMAGKSAVAFSDFDGTIIDGEYIRTKLINAKEIVTSELIANAIKANALNVADKFVVCKDGTTLLCGPTRTPFTSGTFSWDSDGPISVSTLGLQNNNNVVITGDSSGFITSFVVPFSMDYNGFEATIVNDDFDGKSSVGFISANASPGCYFYENGRQMSSLTIALKQGVKMVGITDGTRFKGWLITQRFDTTGRGGRMSGVIRGMLIHPENDYYIEDYKYGDWSKGYTIKGDNDTILVTHNLGHSRYCVVGNIYGDSLRSVAFKDITSNSFRIKIFNTDGHIRNETPVSFIMIGDNV